MAIGVLAQVFLKEQSRDIAQGTLGPDFAPWMDPQKFLDTGARYIPVDQIAVAPVRKGKWNPKTGTITYEDGAKEQSTLTPAGLKKAQGPLRPAGRHRQSPGSGRSALRWRSGPRTPGERRSSAGTMPGKLCGHSPGRCTPGTRQSSVSAERPVCGNQIGGPPTKWWGPQRSTPNSPKKRFWPSGTPMSRPWFWPHGTG